MRSGIYLKSIVLIKVSRPNFFLFQYVDGIYVKET